MDWALFMDKYKWIMLFYIAIIILIYVNRKKFEFEAKFIALYKTKFGLKYIENIAAKHKELVKILGYTGIGVGFVGMVVISAFLIKGLYQLFFVPSAPATLSLVIPGVHIPGSPVFVPFWYGIIALFIVVLFHEFGHGIVAKANGIPVNSTGIVFFGPLIGAFVEPDEKHLRKQKEHVKYSVFAAGPFFNVILTVFFAIVLLLVMNPLQNSMIAPKGVSFDELQKGYPAEQFGLRNSTVYNSVNGVLVTDANSFVNQLACLKPGNNVTIGNAHENITITAAENPNEKGKGYLGVMGIKSEYDLKNPSLKPTFDTLMWLSTLFEWIIILSLGIGLANLLPLGPVDGGRMLQVALIDAEGKKKGHKAWIIITLMTLVIILILIIAPILKELL